MVRVPVLCEEEVERRGNLKEKEGCKPRVKRKK